MRTLTTRQLAVPLLALAFALALVLAITLAPGSTAEAAGEHDEPPEFEVTTLLAGPATFTDNVSANFKVRYDRGRALTSNLPRDASNVIMVEATWQPGGTSGWHTHPGPAVISVVEGSVTVTNANDCVPRTYGEGEAFLDPGQGNVHIAANASDTDVAKAVATFFGVPDEKPATIHTDPGDC
jgi:quercetin dioxygenase-like cupin family protein